MAKTHHVTIDGKRWTLKFTRLSGDAAGWTFFENAAKPRRIFVLIASVMPRVLPDLMAS